MRFIRWFTMNKHIISPEGAMQIPVELFITEKVKPNVITLERLKKLASISGVSEKIVALPDIHYKYGTPAPTGIVVVSEEYIIPKIINTDCGMCFMTTELFEEDISPDLLDQLFFTLKKKISVNIRKEPTVSEDELQQFLERGSEALYEREHLDKEELQNIEYRGNLFYENPIPFSQLKQLLPKESFILGRCSLGVLGTGNHFLELQVVSEETDKKLANTFGLRKGQLVFMLHCDSSGFGNAIHDHYKEYRHGRFGMSFKRNLLYKAYLSAGKFPGMKKLLYQLNIRRKYLKEHASWKSNGGGREDFPTVPIKSVAGQHYLLTKYAAINYGFCNRAYVRKLIIESLAEVFHRNVATSLLIDSTHDSFYYEEIDGKMYCVHRNGANRVLPKEFFKKHSLFKHTGQPLLVPGSMGSFSYLCVPLEGVKKTFYSANHGAGRVLEKAEAREKVSMEQFNKEMEQSKVKLYRYGVGNIMEEAPSSFKDVNSVIEAMEKHQLAKPVVKLKPLAVLKGS